MNWKFWEKPKKKKPILTIEIDYDKNLIIKADWDKPSQENELDLANDIAATIILLTNGHLNEAIGSAIISAGSENNNEGLASTILKLVTELGSNYVKRNVEEVLVPKSHQVFSNSNYFVGDNDDNNQDYS